MEIDWQHEQITGLFDLVQRKQGNKAKIQTPEKKNVPGKGNTQSKMDQNTGFRDYYKKTV